jgi:Zn-dependent protease with chaperone function
MAALTFVLMLIAEWSEDRWARYRSINRFYYEFLQLLVQRQDSFDDVQGGGNDSQQRPELHAIVEDLVNKAALPKPRVYVHTIGHAQRVRNRTQSVARGGAVTTGIMNILNKEELKGVIAHELSHIRHYDYSTAASPAQLWAR